MAATGKEKDYGLADQTKAERRRVPKGRVRVGVLEGWDWSCMEENGRKRPLLECGGEFYSAVNLPSAVFFYVYHVCPRSCSLLAEGPPLTGRDP
jgi:hypothetical protein